MNLDKLPEAITFDDVLIEPNYSEILPADADLTTQLTRNIKLNIPLLSAGMDTVTEAKMAIALAQEGGIGVIHKSMPISEQVKQVVQVKKFESGVVKNPITISSNSTVKDLDSLKQLHNISGVPVVDDGVLVGIVTSRDVRFLKDKNTLIKQVMTKQDQLVVVDANTSQEQQLILLNKHRIEKLLLVQDKTAKNYKLEGLITVKDIEKSERYPNSSKDKEGRLLVAACVGVLNLEQYQKLVAVGVDALVVDTAHGHSKNVIATVKLIKANFSVDVIAGNIATTRAAQDLIKAGVDAVKVGIGPGSICTTRMIAGVGVPQITAIANVAAVTKKSGIPLIADGGIRYSGDISKSLIAGASSVMMGSIFAGTDESPGDIEIYQGNSYKVYRGMGSIGAMSKTFGSSDRYAQKNINAQKLVPEGIEGRVAYKGGVARIIQQLTGGLRSTMGYTGCKVISEMPEKCKFIKISSAAMRESHVHDVSISKQAPNYTQD